MCVCVCKGVYNNVFVGCVTLLQGCSRKAPPSQWGGCSSWWCPQGGGSSVQTVAGIIETSSCSGGGDGDGDNKPFGQLLLLFVLLKCAWVVGLPIIWPRRFKPPWYDQWSKVPMSCEASPLPLLSAVRVAHLLVFSGSFLQVATHCTSTCLTTAHAALPITNAAVFSPLMKTISRGNGNCIMGLVPMVRGSERKQLPPPPRDPSVTALISLITSGGVLCCRSLLAPRCGLFQVLLVVQRSLLLVSYPGSFITRCARTHPLLY